jgi:hypothetical protein
MTLLDGCAAVGGTCYNTRGAHHPFILGMNSLHENRLDWNTSWPVCTTLARVFLCSYSGDHQSVHRIALPLGGTPSFHSLV